MRADLEPSIALLQARARWGEDVVVAGLFRPGPAATARSSLARAVSRRSTRKRSGLPSRLLVAVDAEGRALVCPLAADAQGGHPDGDDLYAGPFENLAAESAGELAMTVVLEATGPVVLEAVWLDRDAAAIAGLLTGDPLPDEPEAPPLDGLDPLRPEGLGQGDQDSGEPA